MNYIKSQIIIIIIILIRFIGIYYFTVDINCKVSIWAYNV